MKTIKVEMKQDGLRMDVDRQEFAMALKTWRLRVGKTQVEVAREWGLSKWTILRLEAARNVSWETAYRVFAKLSEALKKENEK